MSTDAIGVAFGRDDATVATRSPQSGTESSNELTGIAAAIERVEALLAACGPAPEGADAIERIADIAFVLHERDVEASLCDALDAAVRELNNANVVKHANVQHVRQAAELLRELSLRVADMIALLQVSLPPPAAGEANAVEAAPQDGEPAPVAQQASEDTLDGIILDGEIPRVGLFAAELLEDDEFARAVAELAASLPALAEPVDAAVLTLREPADLAAEAVVLAFEPEEAIAEAQPEAADLAANEAAASSGAGEAVVGAQSEATNLAADETVPASEAEEALAEPPPESAGFATKEPAPASQAEALAAEFRPEATDPVAKEPDLVSESERALTELACEPSDLAPEEAALEALAIEPAPAEEFPAAAIADAELSHDAIAAVGAIAEQSKDETISDTTLLSESALSETLSGEALLENADLPGNSPDYSSASADVAVSAQESDQETDTVSEAAEIPSASAPEEVADSEIALAPDEAPAAEPEAEPDLALGDAPPSSPIDGASVAAEPPSDHVMAHHNGGDGSVTIADEPIAHDADDAIAEAASDVNEQPAQEPRASESSQSLLPELALVDPQDDPGDLFEPLAEPAPQRAAAKLARARDISVVAATLRTYSVGAATDPLAAMRALSAEELLALFT